MGRRCRSCCRSGWCHALMPCCGCADEVLERIVERRYVCVYCRRTYATLSGLARLRAVDELSEDRLVTHARRVRLQDFHEGGKRPKR